MAPLLDDGSVLENQRCDRLARDPSRREDREDLVGNSSQLFYLSPLGVERGKLQRNKSSVMDGSVNDEPQLRRLEVDLGLLGLT